MLLGERIYKLRTEKNLSQGDLADALEVSRQSISKWETNSSVPELDKLVGLCEIFGISLDELVTGNKVAQPSTPPPQTEPQVIYIEKAAKPSMYMTKLPKIASLILCIAMGFSPVCSLIALIFGYHFQIFNETLWYLLLIAGTLGCFLLLRKAEESYFWCGLLPLFALGNWICSIYTGIFPMILAILMFFTTVPLLMRHTGIDWLKITAMGIAGLLCVPLLGFSLLNRMVHQMPPSQVQLIQHSPNKTYYAEAIQVWQSEEESIAIVKVYENSGFDIGFCSASKRPVTVYNGELILEIKWENDNCLLIDGVQYPID